jgi:hypothetical protein
MAPSNVESKIFTDIELKNRMEKKVEQSDNTIPKRLHLIFTIIESTTDFALVNQRQTMKRCNPSKPVWRRMNMQKSRDSAGQLQKLRNIGPKISSSGFTETDGCRNPLVFHLLGFYFNERLAQERATDIIFPALPCRPTDDLFVCDFD